MLASFEQLFMIGTSPASLRTHIYHCFHQHVPIKGTFYHPAVIWYIQCVPKNSGQFKYILLRLWFSSMLVISTWTVVVNTSLACVFDLVSSFSKTNDIFICWPFSSLPILRHFDTSILPTSRHFNSTDASTLRHFNPTNFSTLQLYRRFDTSTLHSYQLIDTSNLPTLRHFNTSIPLWNTMTPSWLPGLITQLANLAVSRAHYFLSSTFIIDQAFLTSKIVLLCIASFPGCSLLHVKSCGHDLLEEGVL